jgi:DNA-binding transcriptional ArsR family regulator
MGRLAHARQTNGVSPGLYVWAYLRFGTKRGILVVTPILGGVEMSTEMVVELLEQIKALLIPISDAFRAEYEERLRVQSSLEQVVNTPARKRAYPLMNGLRSQSDIAQESGLSQPAVSRFVPPLLEAELIDIVRDGAVEKPRALYDIETGMPLRRPHRGE